MLFLYIFFFSGCTCDFNLDVSDLLLLPKGQCAKKIEEFTDLLGSEIVHVIQDTL